MAAGPWVVYQQTRLNLLNGQLDLDHDMVLIPVASSYAPDTSDATIADIEDHEVLNPADDASRRATLANKTYDSSVPGQVTYDADDVTLPDFSAPVDVKYVVWADNLTGNLIAYFDTDVGGNADGVRITQLKVQTPAGIMRLA